MSDTEPIETEKPPREINSYHSAAPCRVASSESNLRGECLRCGAGAGTPCPMSRTE
jgi:hypothetical protein